MKSLLSMFQKSSASNTVGNSVGNTTDTGGTSTSSTSSTPSSTKTKKVRRVKKTKSKKPKSATKTSDPDPSTLGSKEPAANFNKPKPTYPSPVDDDDSQDAKDISDSESSVSDELQSASDSGSGGDNATNSDGTDAESGSNSSSSEDDESDDDSNSSESDSDSGPAGPGPTSSTSVPTTTLTAPADDSDCIICQEELNNPVKLECNHQYCFSCIKGAVIQSGPECPLCRHKIDKKYRNMIFKHPEQLCHDVSELDGDYYWIYSGKHYGWWYFESKANDELEKLYQLHQKGELKTDDNLVTICGYMFTFDFAEMEQQNKQNGAIRHIKRFNKTELEDFKKNNQIKGVCGIQTGNQP